MAAKKAMNLVFAGVGGQGILLASDILCDVALREGYDTKKSEVHGMAQRGGSVVSQVRFAEKVYSPLIPLGTADAIVAFEKLEALRYLDYLKPGGLVILNDHKIVPQTVQMGIAEYPKDVLSLCSGRAGLVISEKLTDLAVRLGNIRVLNIITLGVLSHFLPFSESSWLEAIRVRVPPKYVDLNLGAFEEGRKIGARYTAQFQDLVTAENE
jgi:indolepyruvate ferredoxin oxidoreductase beta subunit